MLPEHGMTMPEYRYDGSPRRLAHARPVWQSKMRQVFSDEKDSSTAVLVVMQKALVRT